uniref:Family with sequence similarity 185 member A n=1 Tax=Neogobius melanostomus TaxID=47308 RepID=A0A8C6TJT9_9GOBI
MECDICKVSTQLGDCTLHSVKGHHVKVRSSGGRVIGLGTIHGNVDILTSGESAVDIKKLQGTTMNVSTEHGSMKVKAIYAEFSSISSCTGRVELGLVHGGATVRNESGETVIDGSNGVLKVSSHTGLIDVYVGEGGSADIQSQQGAVSVRVPSSVRAGLELCGSSVDISPEVAFHQTEKLQAPGQTTVTGFVNGDSADQPQVRARSTGPVKLRTQSWFESLKLTS